MQRLAAAGAAWQLSALIESTGASAASGRHKVHVCRMRVADRRVDLRLEAPVPLASWREALAHDDEAIRDKVS